MVFTVGACAWQTPQHSHDCRVLPCPQPAGDSSCCQHWLGAFRGWIRVLEGGRTPRGLTRAVSPGLPSWSLRQRLPPPVQLEELSRTRGRCLLHQTPQINALKCCLPAQHTLTSRVTGAGEGARAWPRPCGVFCSGWLQLGACDCLEREPGTEAPAHPSCAANPRFWEVPSSPLGTSQEFNTQPPRGQLCAGSGSPLGLVRQLSSKPSSDKVFGVSGAR